MNKFNEVISFFQKNRIARHILFWLCVLTVTVPKGLLEHHESVFKLSVYNTSFLVSQILASYFFAYFVIPKFILTRKYVVAALLSFLGLYFFSALARIVMVHIAEPIAREGVFVQETILQILTDLEKLFIHYMPHVYSAVLVFLFVKYFLNYRKVKDRDLKFQKEKSENELKMLKAQLNPHFLFNTLNNIYTLALSNSPKTATSIGKLSEILDHVLYKCNDKYVALSNEIELLENYIELEKLRYDERLKVSFEKELNSNPKIPPLILLSLVENAFKHGAGEDSGSPEITFKVVSDNNELIFSVANTVSVDYAVKKESIGLSNIRKQLDLVYNDFYDLNVEVKDNWFNVELKINQLEIK